MALESDEELLCMLESVDGAETWHMESGESFQADYYRPTNDDGNVLGYQPTLMVTHAVAQRLTERCIVWRRHDKTRFEVHAKEPFGDESFTIVALRARN